LDSIIQPADTMSHKWRWWLLNSGLLDQFHEGKTFPKRVSQVILDGSGDDLKDKAVKLAERNDVGAS